MSSLVNRTGDLLADPQLQRELMYFTVYISYNNIIMLLVCLLFIFLFLSLLFLFSVVVFF